MKLINGKFYEGDKLVPLEFGNKEQIHLIREAEKLSNLLNGNGLTVDPEIETTITANVNFRCICGKLVHFYERELTKERDAHKELKGEICKCNNCQRKYVLDIYDKELVVKIRK